MNPHVISFSGGQTSGYMLRRLIDSTPDFSAKFSIVFNNTGREYDETLDFVQAVSCEWGVPIIWTEYARKDGEHSFRVVDYKTAARRSSPRGPFDEMLEWAGVLPNVQGIGCSGQLKVRTTRRFLQSLGMETWHTYVGIRADEAHRTLEIMASCPKYITPHFPLNEDGITIRDVNSFWDAQPFKLNIPNYKGNCDLCFLKARWKRAAILREDPSAAAWWQGWEEKMSARGVTANGARWIADKSIEGLLNDATHPEFNFSEQSEQDVPCSCAVGGYREENAANPLTKTALDVAH